MDHAPLLNREVWGQEIKRQPCCGSPDRRLEARVPGFDRRVEVRMILEEQLLQEQEEVLQEQSSAGN